MSKESKKAARAAKRQRKLERQARKKLQRSMKSKKTQGKEMFGFGKDKKTYSYGYQKEVIPTTGIDDTTMSTVLFRQSTLDKIGEICLPAAGDSEFQVHYRCLQIIIGSETGQRLVVTVPTVFFNMPQKVSSASVDFSLDDVNEISEKVIPVSEALSEKYFAAFPTELFKNLGFTIEARENEIGSMHRHPGAFGFSGTDLDNKVKHPGVIFRTLGATDRIQVDSVMYIPDTRVNIYTTETRVVDVKPTEDGEGIEGTYLRTPTFSYIIDDASKPVDFFEFFGQPLKEGEISFTTDKDKSDKEYNEMMDIFGVFLDNLQEAYEPVLIIDPDLIEQSYAYYNRGAITTRTWPATSKAKTYEAYNAVGEEYDEYGVYDEYEYASPIVGGSNAPVVPAVAAPDVRPTWRKVQTLGLLRTKGIDVNSNPQISGNGSVVDIRAITKALREEGFSGVDIDAFFAQAAYTDNMLTRAYNAPGGMPGAVV